MTAQNWTEQTDAEANIYFRTLTTPEIRRRQDLCTQQIGMAWEHRNDAALADLRRMEDALTREMLRRVQP